MKLVIILTTFIYTFFPSISYANQDWKTYNETFSGTINAIEVEGETVWISLLGGGVVTFNKNTGVTIVYKVDHGLAHRSVYDMVIDRNGVKWFGTESGISRFDGETWQSYTKKAEIGEVPIIGTAVDHDNVVWFISKYSVSTYDGSKWHVYSYENDFPVSSLTSIAVDLDNTIWITTNKKGILSFNNNEWILHDEFKLPFVTIAVDSNNNKLFGDHTGSIVKYDGSEWTIMRVTESSYSLNYLEVDTDDVIWIATYEGLYRIIDDYKTLFTEEDGVEGTQCSVVHAEDNDTIWIGGDESLIKFDGIQFTNRLAYSGPVDGNIYSIAIDKNNVKWFGHNSSRVSFFDDYSWSEIRNSNFDIIGEKIVVDSNNNKWFTAGRGHVLRYENNEFYDINIINYNVFNMGYMLFPLSMVADKNNNVFIGGAIKSEDLNMGFPHKGNIFMYNGYQMSIIHYFFSSKISLTLDSNNDLWFSNGYRFCFKNISGQGETIYLEDLFTSFKEDVSFNSSIKNIYMDNNDLLWIYEQNKGLACFDGKSWTEYNFFNSQLPSNFVLAIQADQNNTKWIGTGSGVSRFDGETWTTFNTKNSGIASNTVYSIAVEKNNTIWFGTDNGVSKYTGEVITTSVDEDETKPEALPVIKTYPNPFNPATTIEFSIPQNSFATLAIYNIAGQKVKELIAENMTAGTHSAVWDGKDESGEAVSAGIYITRLKAGNQVATGKMVLVK